MSKAVVKTPKRLPIPLLINPNSNPVAELTKDFGMAAVKNGCVYVCSACIWNMRLPDVRA